MCGDGGIRENVNQGKDCSEDSGEGYLSGPPCDATVVLEKVCCLTVTSFQRPGRRRGEHRRASQWGRTPHSGPERTGPVRASVPQGARLSRRPPGEGGRVSSRLPRSLRKTRAELPPRRPLRVHSLGGVAWRPGPWSNALPREGALGPLGQPQLWSGGQPQLWSGGQPLLTDQSFSSARAASWRRGRPAARGRHCVLPTSPLSRGFLP